MILTRPYFRTDGARRRNLLTNSDFEIGDPPTGWTLAGAGASWAQSIEQVHNGTYSGKLTRVTNDCFAYQNYANYAKYKGLPVTARCWVYATVASRAIIRLVDGVGTGQAIHSGVAGWEYLTATLVVSSSAIALTLRCCVLTGDTSAYFDNATIEVR